jgi:hypothetical protein
MQYQRDTMQDQAQSNNHGKEDTNQTLVRSNVAALSLTGDNPKEERLPSPGSRPLDSRIENGTIMMMFSLFDR